MVRCSGSSFQAFITFFLCCLMVGICSDVSSQQRKKTYLVSIKIGRGSPPVSGFLVSANDSALVILPGLLTKRGLEAALTVSKPIPIPTTVIKKVKIVKLRRGATYVLTAIPISIGYSIALATISLPRTGLDLLAHGATTTALTLFTLQAIYVRTFKPTDPAFTFELQKYCMESALRPDG